MGPRLPDWPTRLAHLLDAAAHRPFVWGTHDCCTLAADAVQALTGQDPMAPLRGRWASERQAAELLRLLGGLQPAVSAALQAEPTLPAMAQRGDVVLLAMGNTQALGVCAGRWVAAAGPGGLAFVDLYARSGDTRPMAAWRI